MAWQYVSIIPTMTADNAPSPYVVSANYSIYFGRPVFHGFDNSATSNLLSIDGVTAGIVTMDLGSGNGKVVKKYTIYPENGQYTRFPSDWTFEGSNNGTDWDVLDTQAGQTAADMNGEEYIITNTTSYRYYRLNITDNNGSTYLSMSQISIYDYQNVPVYTGIMPTMTANDAPASYVVGANYAFYGAGAAWKIFNGVGGESGWPSSGTQSGIITMDLGAGNEKVVKRYWLCPEISNLGRYPKDYTFEGSNNGTDWDTLDTKTGETCATNAGEYYLVTNTTSYRYYRLNVTANTNGSYLSLSEIQIYESDEEAPPAGNSGIILATFI